MHGEGSRVVGSKFVGALRVFREAISKSNKVYAVSEVLITSGNANVVLVGICTARQYTARVEGVVLN